MPSPAPSRGTAAELRQNIVVLNCDGVSGTIGFNGLASAPADGYTLGGGRTTIANAPYLVKGARDQVTSFDYVCQYYENVFSLAVPRDLRFKSAEELFAAARATPGKLAYGHAGVGPNLTPPSRTCPRLGIKVPIRAVSRRNADAAGADQRRS